MDLLTGLTVLRVGSSRATNYLSELLEDLGAVVQSAPIGPDVAVANDVLITSAGPNELKKSGLFGRLENAATRAIWLSITPWGLGGPWADHPASDLVLGAESGLQYTIGEPDREPLRLPGSLPSTITAHAALTALLGALAFRDRNGKGQLVDVSGLAVMASNHELATVLFAHTGRQKERDGGRLMSSAPWTLLPCKDGFIGVIVPEGRWADFVQVSGNARLEEERFSTRPGRVQHVLELEAILTEWMADKTEAELYQLAQDLLLPWAPVVSLRECLEDQQLSEREFVQRSGNAQAQVRFPARVTFAQDARHSDEEANASSLNSPLAGVRVLDFGIAWAGALAGRQLGDLGADVIKIETRRRLDTRGSLMASPAGVYVDNNAGPEPWNRSGTFVDRHRNKRSVAIELDRAEGRDLLIELTKKADILIENFAPRVLGNLGVGYSVLSNANPQLVFVSLSGFGHSGPRRNQAAFGDTIEQASGSTEVCGYVGGPPFNSGTHWPDTASGFLAAAMAIAGWRSAIRTGRGMHVDISELEVAVRAMPDLLEFVNRTGRSPGRTGNRGWGRDFEDTFRCADGKWLALTLDETSKESLKNELGLTMEVMESETFLRDMLSARFSSLSSDDALRILRTAGSAAGIVRTMDQLFEHEQLSAEGFFQRVEFDGSSFTTIGFTARLERSPMQIFRPAPKFSEHHREILEEVLGLADEDIDRLVQSGAISIRPGL